MNEKSPSHIFLLFLIIAYILFSNFMTNQLENNLIDKKMEIQNLKKNLDLTNDKLQYDEIIINNYKNYINNKKLYKEVESDWDCFIITGYSANDKSQGTNNIIATMFNLDLNRVNNLPIIAVDPEVIPLYSIVEIEGIGAFIALDTGGKIKGARIDILFDTKKDALEFGKQILKVRIIKNDI